MRRAANMTRAGARTFLSASVCELAPHPGGMADNSPTFQRWVREFRGAQVPKGRLKPCAIRQPSLRDLSHRGRWFPTLKRWAIIACPSGTKTWPGFAKDSTQIALQRNAEKRRENEASATLCGSLRLCVKSSQPAE